MTISSAVQSQFFQQDQQQLVRLPLTTYLHSRSPSRSSSTKRSPKAIKTATASSKPIASLAKRNGKPWTPEEHNRFLEALETFPSGPWKLIAERVRTRTTRQTMTHAQKYREKIARRSRAQELDTLLIKRSEPCVLRARKDRSSVTEETEGVDGEKDHCVLGEAGASEAEQQRPEDVTMMEVAMKTKEDDPARQLEERSVNAAIVALLDEYEPFDVLEGDSGAGCHAWDL